ncbi:hypothetical protein WAI453_004492 [Rhynchosporium graminicola]|uniref:GPI anchored protein n=1 Tax=Rhynchosporium graminicola TaxID=2792576 RepID=A0A1E1L5C9_9HELO|nr:uncharacterized protein RCO7_03900 [Rhynchosporium commune]
MKSFGFLSLPIVALSTLTLAHGTEDQLPTAISVYLPSSFEGIVGSTVVIVQGSDSTLSTTLLPSPTGPAASFTPPFLGSPLTETSVMLTSVTSTATDVSIVPSASSTVTEVSVSPTVAISTTLSLVSSTGVSSSTLTHTSASTSTVTTVSSSTAAGAAPTMGASLGGLVGFAAGVLAVL